jgi:ribosomal protein S18 acetylase RimI-like enzyme
VLRACTPSDIDAIAAIRRRAWSAAHGIPLHSDGWENWLTNAQSQGCDILVYERDARIAAFMVIAPRIAHVLMLCVDVPYQRQGIGVAMLDHVRRRFPEGWSLDTMFDPVDTSGFYAKNGLARGRSRLQPAARRQCAEYVWIGEPALSDAARTP